MWPRGILNRSEPRNNMVYVSYGFYLINLLFIFIIPHHSHMCPSPFFSEFSLPRHDCDGYGLFQHCMISTKDIINIRSLTDMDWWAVIDLNLAEERPFLSACWYFDNVFLLGHSGNKLIPSSSSHRHISVSIWEHLAQNHKTFSKLLSIYFSGDDWGHSLKIIVNYEDNYLKHHM